MFYAKRLLEDDSRRKKVQGGKSDATGGLKIAKPLQFWKMIAYSRALEEFYVLEKAVSRGIGGCSTDKKPKNVKMQKL